MPNPATPTRGPRPLHVRQVILLGLAMAATFYFMFTYTGPFKWLAELQLKFFGAYEESLTFLVACLIIALPFLLLEWAIRRVSPDRESTTRATPTWVSAVASVGFGGVIALVGLIMLGLGGWQWWIGRDDTIARLDASVFENGNAPAQRFASVQGVAMFESAAELKSSSSAGVDFYVPVISLDWKEKSPVALFVKVRETELSDSVRASRHDWYPGMLSRGGLPGLVRTEFEQRGPAPASGYFTLELNRTPADQWRVARDLLIFGGVIFAGGVVTSIVQKRSRPIEPVAVTIAPTAGRVDPRFAIRAIKGVSENRSSPAPNEGDNDEQV